MKAKDITQADIGRWVNIKARVELLDLGDGDPVEVRFQNGADCWITADTTLEFCDPPPPVQEVGDVFNAIGKEWTIAVIVGDACLLRSETGSHVSEDYPLNQKIWEFVRKGAAS